MNLRKGVAPLMVVGLAIGLLVFASGHAAQADEGWIINSFHSQVVIASDGSIVVTEDIQVDFGSQQKQGIFRTIPLRYRYDDTRDRFYVLRRRRVLVTARTGP